MNKDWDCVARRTAKVFFQKVLLGLMFLLVCLAIPILPWVSMNFFFPKHPHFGQLFGILLLLATLALILAAIDAFRWFRDQYELCHHSRGE